MLRGRKHVLSQSTTPFACTLHFSIFHLFLGHFPPFRAGGGFSKLLFLFVLCSDFLFSLTAHPPPPSRQTPRPSHPRELDFGPFRLRFGSVWLRFGSVSGPFRVRFGVLGGVGVGSGRGASVREKNITSLV